jgi:tetratricopeptide (TPR) repeat protein
MHRALRSANKRAGFGADLAARLSVPARSSRSQGSTFAALEHRVSPAAQKEADKAANAAKKDRMPEAVAHYEQALSIDPALRTHPRSAPPPRHSSRKALEFDGSIDLAHYIPGTSLALQRKSEALNNLNKASDRFPRARLIAAAILSRRGDVSGARGQLGRYLISGKKDRAGEVKSRLARMEQTTARRRGNSCAASTVLPITCVEAPRRCAILESGVSTLVHTKFSAPFGAHSTVACTRERRGNPRRRTGRHGRRHDARAAQLLRGRAPSRRPGGY